MQRYDWWSHWQRPIRDRSLYDADLWREGYGPRQPLWWGGGFDPRQGGYDRGVGFGRNPGDRRGYDVGYRGPGRHGPPYYADRGADDEELRRMVLRSFERDAALEANRIQVEVHDGVITLSGSVRDYLDARYAWDDAWETPGVRGVISQLEVDQLSE